MIDPDVDRDELKALVATAPADEKADARALLALAGELSADRLQLLELRAAFLMGGDEWRPADGEIG